MSSFNLLHQPWIPVRPADGGPVREVGLRELLLNARDFGRIDDPSPLVSVALLRLSLALLHRALKGPRNAGQAAEWFHDGFPAEKLEGYFAEWEASFDLFHPERPFWQVRGLTLDLEGGKYRSHWSRLGTEVGSANTSPLFNAAGRPGGERDDSLSPAQAARRLVEGQTFLLGGLIKRLTTSARAAPVATFALTAAQGRTLHETLCLNLAGYAGQDHDQAVWEREPLTVDTVRLYHEDGRADLPRGRADRYTWPSRSILLLPEVDEDGETRVTSIGFAAGIPLDGPGEGEGSNIDPMVTLRPPSDPKKSERFPLKLRREQLLWRDLSALLPDPQNELQVVGKPGEQTFKPLRGHPPGTLSHARAVLESLGDEAHPLAVSVTGLLSDQGKAFAYRQETYALPTVFVTDEQGFAMQVDRALNDAKAIAEALRQATARLCAEVISRGGARHPHKEDVSALARTLPGLGAYWAALEAPFRVFLAELGTPEDARDRWQTAVAREARRAWEINLRGAGDDGQVLGFAYRPRKVDNKTIPSPQTILDRALAVMNRPPPSALPQETTA
ncbi:type I-E CRISPR-associated protein Cse1/CasA [Deinococcus arenicola]|uniref:Type I-E CRISPR-associated protein Cse1/CasA n=1 Tax=Deinococcus arenicola TaxID=2994950 RepID=A0ABU4DV17_9DEIO|nr:type I-E CRISPR-associated protein Cse1/CasA [Deinococcus sp. ZS9-10]MDV6376277.1 type I-E CRISPR-associated protein Cse1/CasA [Deinococcus sp. ZS9-10]